MNLGTRTAVEEQVSRRTRTGDAALAAREHERPAIEGNERVTTGEGHCATSSSMFVTRTESRRLNRYPRQPILSPWVGMHAPASQLVGLTS